MNPEDLKQKLARSAILNRSSFDPKTYEYDSSFQPANPDEGLEVHTTQEMVSYLERHKHVEVDAKVLTLRKLSNGDTVLRPTSMAKQSFLESFQKDAARGVRVRKGMGKILEFREDGFGSGTFDNGSLGSTLVGSDFTPLLGGPFYKNLYFYQDYIRMHAEAFYSYHNDPLGKATIRITNDFALGTGYEVQCDTNDRRGKIAMAAWRAFEEVNDLKAQVEQLADEMGIYGEVMFWELPGNETKITYRLGPDDTRPMGIIPRVRLIDPSNIVEIVTYPEDITRPLFYVWLQPTQYQIYTGGTGSSQPSGKVTNIQPTLKFIYRQIPAEQMQHFKINAVSNEKRGRSDLFSIFNYLKRMRDAINYRLISLEKNAAWSIDTVVKGDQVDIDAYIADQRAIGTIPPPGSEFVHSDGIVRQYLATQSTGSKAADDTLSWCLSMISAGGGIPVSWYGTHLSGGQTRASALVSTEPPVKRLERRREKLKRCITALWNLCMDRAGLKGFPCDVILPELITQDRSQKLQDIKFAEDNRWVSPQRAANMGAKELLIDDYDYNEEQQDIKAQLPQVPSPTADPGMPGSGGFPASQAGAMPGSGGAPAAPAGALKAPAPAGALTPAHSDAAPKPAEPAKAPAPGDSGHLSSSDKKGIKQNDSTL